MRQKLTPRLRLRNSHWRQFSSVNRHVDDSGPKLKLVNTFTASFLANLAGPFVVPCLRLCKRGRLLLQTRGGWHRDRSWVDMTNGPITIAIRARFEYDSSTIRLQHATTRYEVFRALAYEIVYENQW